MDKDLEDGQIFYYSVSASNALGEGMACPEQLTTISSTTWCPPGKVELSLSKEDFEYGVQYWLHWSMPDDGGSPIKGFKIFGSMSGSEPRLWMVVDPSVTELLALDLTGIENPEDWGWPVFYWVVAFNDVGQSQMQSGTRTGPARPGINGLCVDRGDTGIGRTDSRLGHLPRQTTKSKNQVNKDPCRHLVPHPMMERSDLALAPSSGHLRHTGIGYLA